MKGADQCPKCASRKWIEPRIADATKFYSIDVRACINCHAIWEPFDPADLLDPKHEPLGAFKAPCNNCAFRKGSPEQADPEKWEAMMLSLSFNSSFYCHKGVPISPASEHGFDYPEDGKNKRKLRLCRGYLNSIVGPRLKRFASDQECRDAINPWVDPVEGPDEDYHDGIAA